MTDMIEESWVLPEVDAVFRFAFAFDPGAVEQGVRVTVICLRPPVESHVLQLRAPIALDFRSGYQLRGEMRVVGDAGWIGVDARIDYDLAGEPPTRYFEGLIFLRETGVSAPPPAG